MPSLVRSGSARLQRAPHPESSSFRTGGVRASSPCERACAAGIHTAGLDSANAARRIIAGLARPPACTVRRWHPSASAASAASDRSRQPTSGPRLRYVRAPQWTGGLRARHDQPMDSAALLSALDAAPGNVADAVRPASPSDVATAWARSEGLAPGRHAGPTASGAAALISAWAARRGWPAVTPIEAGRALRALGLRTVRPAADGDSARGARRWGVASVRQALALRAAAAAALAREGVVSSDDWSAPAQSTAAPPPPRPPSSPGVARAAVRPAACSTAVHGLRDRDGR